MMLIYCLLLVLGTMAEVDGTCYDDIDFVDIVGQSKEGCPGAESLV